MTAKLSTTERIRRRLNRSKGKGRLTAAESVEILDEIDRLWSAIERAEHRYQREQWGTY